MNYISRLKYESDVMSPTTVDYLDLQVNEQFISNEIRGIFVQYICFCSQRVLKLELRNILTMKYGSTLLIHDDTHSKMF